MKAKEKIQILESKLESAMILLEAALVRNAELEALVLKLSTPKTSQNSHIPPSADLTRKNQSLRVRSGKSVGGQKGHKGHTLSMSATPDVVEPLYPSFCTNCGTDLQSYAFDFLSKRQMIDTPPIVPITTEYQCFGTICACGHHQKGEFPTNITRSIQYGPNIQSMVVYQSYFQFLPFGRLQDFFKSVCQVDLCKGTLENIIRKTALKATPAYEAIKEFVMSSNYIGADETCFKANKKKNWFWVWQNALVTYLVAATSRGKSVILEEFPDGLPNAIIGSDRWAAQLSTNSKGKQICLAHLLRDLNYLIDAEQHIEKNTWASDFKRLIKDAIKLKQEKSHYDKNDTLVLELEKRLNALLSETHLEIFKLEPEKNKQAITFFKQIFKLQNALFPFLYHAEVPADNNGSERAFRMVKVKTKVSGQFKSLQHEFAIIRSVIDTSVKNGENVFDAINAIVHSATLAG